MGIKQLLPARLRVAVNVVRNDVHEIGRAFSEERVEIYRVSDGRAYVSAAPNAGEAARAPGPSAAGEAARAPGPSAAGEAARAPGGAGEADRAPDRGGTSVVERVIVFRQSGIELVLNDEQTILEAGLRNGVDLMFSCTLGGCAACILEVVEGEVEYDDPYAIVLTEEEIEEGYCLACVGRPRGRVVVEA